MANKILITSGCSFTETVALQKYGLWDERSGFSVAWPRHLWKSLGTNYHFVNGAMGSQGNGLISKSVIYHVSEALKTFASSNILVGVMWSEPSRFEYRNPEHHLLNLGSRAKASGWMENPTGFIDKHKNWVLCSAHWDHKESTTFYHTFYDPIGALIRTLEYMLLTQYFLQKHNIPYFFTLTTEEIFIPKEFCHEEVNYLYNMLDRNFFLPVSSQLDWLIKNNIRLQDFSNQENLQWNHPSKEQHIIFVDKVIIPYLQQKNYI